MYSFAQLSRSTRSFAKSPCCFELRIRQGGRHELAATTYESMQCCATLIGSTLAEKAFAPVLTLRSKKARGGGTHVFRPVVVLLRAGPCCLQMEAALGHAGLTPVPIHLGMTTERLRKIFSETQAVTLVTSANLIGEFHPDRMAVLHSYVRHLVLANDCSSDLIKAVSLDFEAVRGRKKLAAKTWTVPMLVYKGDIDCPPAQPHGNRVALVSYSAEESQGIPVTYKNLESLDDDFTKFAQERTFKITAESVLLCYAGYHVVIERILTSAVLRQGGSVAYAKVTVGSELLDAVLKSEATHLVIRKRSLVLYWLGKIKDRIEKSWTLASRKATSYALGVKKQRFDRKGICYHDKYDRYLFESLKNRFAPKLEGIFLDYTWGPAERELSCYLSVPLVELSPSLECGGFMFMNTPELALSHPNGVHGCGLVPHLEDSFWVGNREVGILSFSGTRIALGSLGYTDLPASAVGILTCEETGMARMNTGLVASRCRTSPVDASAVCIIGCSGKINVKNPLNHKITSIRTSVVLDLLLSEEMTHGSIFSLSGPKNTLALVLLAATSLSSVNYDLSLLDQLSSGIITALDNSKLKVHMKPKVIVILCKECKDLIQSERHDGLNDTLIEYRLQKLLHDLHDPKRRPGLEPATSNKHSASSFPYPRLVRDEVTFVSIRKMQLLDLISDSEHHPNLPYYGPSEQTPFPPIQNEPETPIRRAASLHDLNFRKKPSDACAGLNSERKSCPSTMRFVIDKGDEDSIGSSSTNDEATLSTPHIEYESLRTTTRRLHSGGSTPRIVAPRNR